MDELTPQNVDTYIAGFPAEVRERLEGIRRVVREAVPEAKETIKYGMPTYMLKGNLLSFGAYKRHIGFYPKPDVSGDEALRKELAAYEAEKSTLRFPFDEAVPYELIGKLVKLRVKEDLERAAAKGKKK
jgi:uncharacterized protein YdhG (YjbR/CyaY superfamily)